jgi:hypothetical protein
VETIKHFSKDEEAWFQFDAEEKARADYKAFIAEGEARGRAETAVKMLNLGMSLDLISQVT